ncbi:isochorismatase [Halorhodospira halochloris]|uniref:Isochorismatase n=1 Tax=Halorhodospira halochloris TaxID=1052 RepID=A0A0X8X7F6_HALHR|nr:isochorismatase family protein [Halorhodospira halochloris]MBK1652477.1 hydrolase [Halorhodospira halochloris]MCG5547448.1 isochorismatase family protein [Halorhodospira halochloris]BAU56373.1 isochorismatase [Halorhodospira halochloris]
MNNGIIDPRRSALLIVDLQQQLLPKIYQGQQVIAAAEWLAAVASQLEVPIFTTEQSPESIGKTVAEIAPWVDETRLYNKNCFGWMSEPEPLHAGLPKQVVVVGTEAHVCVLQSALGLKASGRQVFVVADAVGSRRPSDRELALQRMRDAGIVVVSNEMVAFEWLQRAGTDSFRALLPRLRQGWEVNDG